MLCWRRARRHEMAYFWYEGTLSPSGASRCGARRRLRRRRRWREAPPDRHRNRWVAAHLEADVRRADERGEGQSQVAGPDVPEGGLDPVLDDQEAGRDAARAAGREGGRGREARHRGHTERGPDSARPGQEAVL